jgi:hypothetical protein
MEITILRPPTKGKATTISKVLVDGKPFGYCCEDQDRGLVRGDMLSYIASIKVPAQTAIPFGEYEVVMTYSNRFKKMLPLLLDVPGFEGIRIHAGNTKDHTEGCLLIGYECTASSVLDSRNAVRDLINLILKAIKKEKVTCRIIYDQGKSIS